MGHKLRRVTNLSRFRDLIRLDLSDNLLNSCEGLEVLESSLQHLNLSQNHIKSLTPLLRLSQLQVLDLSNNRIANIPSKISSLVSLTTLHLDSNEIQDISALVPLRSLRHLSLTRNKIQNYVEYVRSNFPHLETLDESYLHRKQSDEERDNNIPKSWQTLFDATEAIVLTPTKHKRQDNHTSSETTIAISTAQKSAIQAANASSIAADRSSLAATHALKAQQITIHTQVTSMANRLNLLRGEMRTAEMAHAKASSECEDSLRKLTHSERLRIERLEAANTEHRCMEAYESESKMLKESITRETKEIASLQNKHTDLVNRTKSLSTELERRRQIVHDLSERHRIAIENLAITNRDLHAETKCVADLRREIDTETLAFQDMCRRRVIEQKNLSETEINSASGRLSMKRIAHELETHEMRHHDSLENLRRVERSYANEKERLNKDLEASRRELHQQLEKVRHETETLRKTSVYCDTAKDALSETKLQWSATRRSIETERKELERVSAELEQVSSRVRDSTKGQNALENELKLLREEVKAETLSFDEMSGEMSFWREKKSTDLHTLHTERVSLSTMRRQLKSELSSAAETMALHDQRALKMKRLGREFDTVRSAEMRFRLEKQNAERQLNTARKASVSSREKIRTLHRELTESERTCSSLRHHNTELSDKLSCVKTSEKHRGNRTRRLQVEFEQMRGEHGKAEEALLCSRHEIDILRRRTAKEAKKAEDAAEELNRLRTQLSEYVFFSLS